MLDDHVRDSHGHVETGGGFIVGLVTGALLGVGLGLLLAPKTGADLRGSLSARARTFGAKASERYQRASEAATSLAERSREIVSQTREAVNRGAEEVRDFTGGGADSISSTNSSDGGSASDESDSFRI